MATLGMKYQLQEGLGARGEPLRKTNFEIEIPSILDVLTLYVVSFTCPEGEIEKMEVRDQNGVAYLAGKPSMTDGALVVRDVIDPQMFEGLNSWKNAVYNPETDVIGYASEYKRRAYVHMNDSKGARIRSYELVGVWPTKVSPGEMVTGDFEGRQIEIALSCDQFRVL